MPILENIQGSIHAADLHMSANLFPRMTASRTYTGTAAREFWPVRRGARQSLRTRGPMQFRIVAGERYAENQQAERLVERTIAREVQFGSIPKAIILNRIAADKVRFLHEFVLDQTQAEVLRLHDRVTDLHGENKKLKQEVSHLRSLLAKTSHCPARQEPKLSNSYEVAELLALVDTGEAGQLLQLIDNGALTIDMLVSELGVQRAVRLSNLLGRSNVAVAHAGKLVTTAVGAALAKSLADLNFANAEGPA